MGSGTILHTFASFDPPNFGIIYWLLQPPGCTFGENWCLNSAFCNLLHELEDLNSIFNIQNISCDWSILSIWVAIYIYKCTYIYIQIHIHPGVNRIFHHFSQSFDSALGIQKLQFHLLSTWNPKASQPFINGWESIGWWTQSLHRKWLEITKHLFINGWKWASRYSRGWWSRSPTHPPTYKAARPTAPTSSWGCCTMKSLENCLPLKMCWSKETWE